MKVKIEKNPFAGSKPDSEASAAIKEAIMLTRGKGGYRCAGEYRRDLELHVMEGHNIYTTVIVLADKTGLAPAYFCNGAFRLRRCGFKFELIKKNGMLWKK
jgi:hypothetical protein